MRMEKGCELEPRIILALETSGISDNVRQHMRECETCRDAVIAGDWMIRFAALPMEEVALPNPAVIWLKAQLLQQNRSLGALAQAMSWGQTVAFGLLAFSWAALLSWKWSAIEAFAAAVRSGGILWSVVESAPAQMPLVLTIVLLTCATIAMTVQSVLLEE